MKNPKTCRFPVQKANSSTYAVPRRLIYFSFPSLSLSFSHREPKKSTKRGSIVCRRDPLTRRFFLAHEDDVVVTVVVVVVIVSGFLRWSMSISISSNSRCVARRGQQRRLNYVPDANTRVLSGAAGVLHPSFNFLENSAHEIRDLHPFTL